MALDIDSRPCIYVSSKRQHTELWRKFRHRGHRIISSWIDLEGAFDAETIGHDYWPTRLSEAQVSDFLVFYAHPQDGDHSDCLLEIGAALAAGVPVLQVGVSQNMKTKDDEMASFTYHPMWHRFADLEAAFSFVADQIHGAAG